MRHPRSSSSNYINNSSLPRLPSRPCAFSCFASQFLLEIDLINTNDSKIVRLTLLPLEARLPGFRDRAEWKGNRKRVFKSCPMTNRTNSSLRFPLPRILLDSKRTPKDNNENFIPLSRGISVSEPVKRKTKQKISINKIMNAEEIFKASRTRNSWGKKTSFKQKEKKKIFEAHRARIVEKKHRIKLNLKNVFDLVSHFAEMENGFRCVFTLARRR